MQHLISSGSDDVIVDFCAGGVSVLSITRVRGSMHDLLGTFGDSISLQLPTVSGD